MHGMLAVCSPSTTRFPRTLGRRPVQVLFARNGGQDKRTGGGLGRGMQYGRAAGERTSCEVRVIGAASEGIDWGSAVAPTAEIKPREQVVIAGLVLPIVREGLGIGQRPAPAPRGGQHSEWPDLRAR
jgi:hypothetical protein